MMKRKSYVIKLDPIKYGTALQNPSARKGFKCSRMAQKQRTFLINSRTYHTWW